MTGASLAEASGGSEGYQRTRTAVIWSNLLSEPLQTVYSFIPFLLYRDLHATAFMVAVLTTAKPVVSIFSMYWSHPILERPEKLRSNVIWAGLLGRLPFFFFPWIRNPWVIIACAAFYMLAYRGAGPAWMEMLRRNLPKKERGPLYSLGSALAYGEGVLLALAVGILMDSDVGLWRWIFPIAASVGLLGIFLQARVPVETDGKPSRWPRPSRPLGEQLWQPWRAAMDLMRRRQDFGRFQWGFMLAGSGLMLVSPALPLFFADVLGISYTELAIAIAVCKGLGFSLASPVWGRYLNHRGIFNFSSWVFFLVACFPVWILMAQFNIAWLYVGYFLYGVAQAGSHLCWNLSGPIFAEDEDSSIYSSVNVVMVGVRGAIVPFIGAALATGLGCQVPLLCGMALCISAGLMMRYQERLFPRLANG